MRQKGIVVLPVIIIVLLIGVVGYFIYQNTQLRQNNSQNQLPQASILTTTPTESLMESSPTINPRANWKTYTNTKYGYTFKYPPEFTLDSYGQVSGEEGTIELTKANNNPQTSILVDASISETSKSLYLDYKSRADGNTATGQLIEGGSEVAVSMSEIQLANNIAYQGVLESNTDILINILIERNNLIYGLQFITEVKEDKALFDQILSTFKFL